MIKDAFANRPQKRKHLVSSSMEPHFPPLVQGPSDLLLRGNEAKKRKGNRRWFHCCTNTPGKAPENPASCHRDFSLLHKPPPLMLSRKMFSYNKLQVHVHLDPTFHPWSPFDILFSSHDMALRHILLSIFGLILRKSMVNQGLE